MGGAAAFVVAEEGAGEAAGDFGGDLPEVHEDARAGGALHLELLAIVVMEFLERFDEQIVDGEPDGAAPVGVAAEDAGAGFGGLITDSVLVARRFEAIGVVLVKAG